MTAQSGTNSRCTIIGTRAQIRAFKLSGTLDTSCVYSITGYSRGCLGSVESIMLRPTSPSSFANDVEVLTSFDDHSWTGKYDIDTNRITSLEDNRGNRVYGQNGAEVDAFPWGAANWRENLVDNAQLLSDCVPTVELHNSRFTTDSFTDLRGTTGTIPVSYTHLTLPTTPYV